MSTGLPHDILGYAVLMLAAALVFNFDTFVGGLTELVPDQVLPGLQCRNPIIAAFNRLIGSPDEETEFPPSPADSVPMTSRSWNTVLAACIVVGVAGFSTQTAALLIRSGHPAGTRHDVTASNPDRLVETSLDETVAGFTRVGYETETRDPGSREGESSNVWSLRGQSLMPRVSCDYLFCGWHDLRDCYTGIGWLVVDSQLTERRSEWPAMQVSLIKHRIGTHGILFFSLFTAAGESFQLPTPGNALDLVLDRVASDFRGTLLDVAPDTIQCQTFCQSSVPFTKDQVEILRQLHVETRRQIKSAMLQDSSRGEQGTPTSQDPVPDSPPPNPPDR